MEHAEYIAIDLKSFYASVACVDRGLNPLTTNLVVADPGRSEKTICLAVTPSLKQFGIPGRPRLFEVMEKIRKINAERMIHAPNLRFTGKSVHLEELQKSPQLAVDYLVAMPQMARYIEVSTQIYQIYLHYVAPEDIHVYSIDEVFMDISSYRGLYRKSAEDLAREIIADIYQTTGITATAGIGTNLYLAKIAMDLVAKHTTPDRFGARVATLNERTYRETLWNHEPLTDFWRIGPGIAKKLAQHGIFTMGDIARCSLGQEHMYHNEDLLFRLFGVNAEWLIDHAWGWEPCTMKAIKQYQPQDKSLGSGQVLPHGYTYSDGELIIREMADVLSLQLTEKALVCNQVVLTVGYEKGRSIGVDKAHGSKKLQEYSSSGRKLTEAFVSLYREIVDETRLVRRVFLTVNHVLPESSAKAHPPKQMQLFFSEPTKEECLQETIDLQKEKQGQQAVLQLQKKYGKNVVLKGMNLLDGAMTIERNGQIGGHHA